MPMPNTQPSLPAEGTYTDAELLFLSEEPKRLFPQNQNSNFGALRKVLTSQPQEAIDLLTDLNSQMYVETATGTNGYLGLWEVMMGLPKAPSGRTDEQRRTWVNARRRLGLFSVARLQSIVESFLQDEFGTPVTFDAFGVPFDAGGLPLLGEGGPVASQYRIYFNPRNFSYEVWIINSVSPDLTSLSRELLHVTPAGMSFTIDNTKANVLNYGMQQISLQPVAYLKMGADFNDYSGYANHGTAFNSPVVVASPGLLTAGLDGLDGARDFNGTTMYVTVPDQNYLDLGTRLTYKALIRVDSLASICTIISKNTNAISVAVGTNGQILVYNESNAILAQTTATGVITVGPTYHVAVTVDGIKPRIYVDGVEKPCTYNLATFGSIANNSSALNIGRRAWLGDDFFNGVLDEVTVFNRPLTLAEIYYDYRVFKNLNP